MIKFGGKMCEVKVFLKMVENLVFKLLIFIFLNLKLGLIIVLVVGFLLDVLSFRGEFVFL